MRRAASTTPGAQRPLSGIFFSFALTSAGFGTLTVSTPLAKLALTCSGSTWNGRAIERANEP